MKTIAADNENLIWSGAVSLEHGNGWVKPWRLPFDQLDFFHEASFEMAERPSGVRLRFATDSRNIAFRTEAFKCPFEDIVIIHDLYCNDKFYQSSKTQPDSSDIKFDNLPGGMKTIELWLFQFSPFMLKSIEIDDGASIEKSPDTRPKWITYGSSITHCRAAESPSMTWPAIVARKKNLNLTSLGYGGQCHADPMVARMIRDMSADFISLKLGINIYGHASFNIRSFRPAVIGTIATIREKHTDTPIVVFSPIWSPPRESTPNPTNMTLEIMREEVEKAVKAFQKHGDENIYYINGLNLFDSPLADMLPDELHPDAEGYKIMAQNFMKAVFEETGIKICKGRTP